MCVFPFQFTVILSCWTLDCKDNNTSVISGDFCGRCVAGDISNPVKSIDEIEVETVANFCEIFAQVCRCI